MKKYIKLSKRIYKNKGIQEYRRRASFVLRAILNNSGMKRLFMFFNENPLFQDIAVHYPAVFSQAIRPIFYRNSTFRERETLIKEHYLFMKERFTEEAIRAIYLGEGFTLWNAEYQDKNLALRLNYQISELKEGLMTVELDIDEDTVYQVVFWFASGPKDKTVLWIGALQGAAGGSKTIRDLTRHFFAYRPKNLIIYALRTIASRLGIEEIYAVSNYGFYDSNLPQHKQKLKSSLDSLWQETGGEITKDSRFYKLPITELRKSLEEVGSQKRNLYRKRFAMLDEISGTIVESLEKYLRVYKNNA